MHSRVLFVVDLAAMADLQNKHYDTFVFDATDEAKVVNAITPQASEVASKRFSKSAWVVGCGDAFPQIAKDGLLDS